MTDLKLNIDPTPSLSDLSDISKISDHSQTTHTTSAIMLFCGGLLLSGYILTGHFPAVTEGFKKTFTKSEELSAEQEPNNDASSLKLEKTTDQEIQKTKPSAFEAAKKLLTNSSRGPKWPKMKISGIGKSPVEADSFAIINGKPIHLQQSIKGVRLIQINEESIILELEGETKQFWTEE